MVTERGPGNSNVPEHRFAGRARGASGGLGLRPREYTEAIPRISGIAGSNSRQARKHPLNRHDRTLRRRKRPRNSDDTIMLGTLAGIAALPVRTGTIRRLLAYTPGLAAQSCPSRRAPHRGRDGGTGRRAGLKIQYWRQCASSSLAPGTNPSPPFTSGVAPPRPARSPRVPGRPASVATRRDPARRSHPHAAHVGPHRDPRTMRCPVAVLAEGPVAAASTRAGGTSGATLEVHPGRRRAGISRPLLRTQSGSGFR